MPGKKTEARLLSLGQAALANSGAFVLFSQGSELGPMYRTFGMGGVCKALSLYWIGFHATDDSFWHWIYADPKAGRIRQKGANQLHGALVIMLHTEYGDRRQDRHTHLANAPVANDMLTGGPRPARAERSEIYKDAFAESFLRPYKVTPRRGITGSDAFRATASIGGSRLTAKEVTDAVTAHTGCYCQLSTSGGSGTHGKHAMALWVGQQDISFFDPNNGEFWFPNHKAFQRWMVTFLGVTGYDRKYSSLNTRWYNAAA
ncbi:YopT-type cysteine protease domain-containing protein [Roseospira visakhapatnamensis]|uniref:YopT peptidase n=1 Tax=Roseospira visakhapatnamensis TaxID=390880 RepID=A0A7W6RAS3_9PROT|nr:YopT-type cysteine protease domain-containing protein [Roseospira visakhapatnamensis]MBB4264897.1 YopT peptidase [Roseospira visakhapatnamensis]